MIVLFSTCIVCLHTAAGPAYMQQQGSGFHMPSAAPDGIVQKQTADDVSKLLILIHLLQHGLILLEWWVFEAVSGGPGCGLRCNTTLCKTNNSSVLQSVYQIALVYLPSTKWSPVLSCATDCPSFCPFPFKVKRHIRFGLWDRFDLFCLVHECVCLCVCTLVNCSCLIIPYIYSVIACVCSSALLVL